MADCSDGRSRPATIRPRRRSPRRVSPSGKRSGSLPGAAPQSTAVQLPVAKQNASSVRRPQSTSGQCPFQRQTTSPSRTGRGSRALNCRVPASGHHTDRTPGEPSRTEIHPPQEDTAIRNWKVWLTAFPGRVLRPARHYCANAHEYGDDSRRSEKYGRINDEFWHNPPSSSYSQVVLCAKDRFHATAADTDRVS